MAKFKRRIKLVDPKLQIQLTMIFVGLSALGLVMQFILFQSTLSQLSADLPNDGNQVMEAVNGILPGVLGITMLVIMPLTYAVGVLTTFRIAGPVYRLKMFLRDIRENGYQEPCRLRNGDKLQGLADEISETVEHLIELHQNSPQESESRDPDRDAA